MGKRAQDGGKAVGKSRKQAGVEIAHEDGTRQGGNPKANGSRPLSGGVLRTGDKSPDSGLPIPVTGSSPAEPTPIFTDNPSTDILPSSDTAPTDIEIPLEHYKGTALKNIGRDARGRVIPHKRSEVTAKKVAVWALGGYTKNDVAVMLNIRPGLVEECYGKELRHGMDMVGMDLTGHIIKRAKKSDRMAIFVAKAKMGWRDGDAKPVDTSLLNIHIHG